LKMKVLILGASGMLGHMACRVLGRSHEVFGTGRSGLDPHSPLARVLSKEAWISGVDAQRNDSVLSVLDRVKPDVVLNCIGVVKQLDEAKDPLTCIEINSLFPHRLARLCSSFKARLIHISTDCVFSGKRGMYSEKDNPDPIDLYGRSKLLGEVTENNALTLRTSIIGRQLTGTTGLVEWFFSQRGKRIKGYKKAIYSGLTTQAFCEVLDKIITGHPALCGLRHVASTPISKCDLLRDLNNRFRLNITINPDERVAIDRSLDGSMFRRETKIYVPSWDKMLDSLQSDNSFYEKG
jgi:dTDP-4-dehydrorhamnose reductase